VLSMIFLPNLRHLLACGRCDKPLPWILLHKIDRPLFILFVFILSMGRAIDKIRTYRTQTPYTFFGHKAFTAISYPGEGAKSQPTG
jgi:hypothetical protein